MGGIWVNSMLELNRFIQISKKTQKAYSVLISFSNQTSATNSTIPSMNPRKHSKILEDSMKTVVVTPISSIRSTTTVESNLSETRDSFYFPGCRKDANCNCEICIASMRATLDLMPQSYHRTSMTKISSSRPVIQRTPVPFASSADVSTPESSPQPKPVVLSPFIDSAASNMLVEKDKEKEKEKKRKRDFNYGSFWSWRGLILVLILFFGLEYGVSWMVKGVLKGRLSPDILKHLGEKSFEFEVLEERLRFLKNELGGIAGHEVSNCSSTDSVWKISQDGMLLYSRCVLYESMAEEVSIWGWPLQNSGLITAKYSSRAFTVISGSVTEWSTGAASYLVRKANSSWEKAKWSSSVVHLDHNTWILEHRKSFLLENPKLVSTAAELLKFRIAREFEKLKQEFGLQLSFGGSNSFVKAKRALVPT